MLRADGVRVSPSSVERALRRQGLLQPRRYQAERRHLAARRKAVFLVTPTRRNRVWQVDFTEFETSVGGTWRILVVVDYATKVCLAAAITGRSAAQDAVDGLRVAIETAEGLLGRTLFDECVDGATGELTRLVIVSDNGPAFKSLGFARFIAGRTELEHVRTRHRAPETNGVVERFNETLKYERLYRYEIRDMLALQAHIRIFLEEYNRVRPHETLGQVAPMVRYLEPPVEAAEPAEPHLSEPETVQLS